ncbi:3-hydroxyacyl-CoA dehydrogenase [Microbacterium indicum]|uniref:3-hydroxyacyl-CoA dehydrogenase n=1 Tax=Microbacterium indicum TaxID=358100 RepID=UPI000407192A|nr:3-hydroxyacyl-CoA dehydrogenase [Microbacterium indicum]
MTDITNVTVLGTGVLGSQIAFQTAYAGFTVTAWDIDDDAVAKAGERFAGLAERYVAEVEGAKDGKSAAALTRLTATSDLAAALADADLVIEAVPESPEIKTSTWQKVGALAPEKTIFATNSSTLLPSSFKDATGRPAKFLALHYANQIWAQNTAEIMGTDDTDPEVFRTVVDFAEKQGMVPIEVRKEQPGYVLNSLLVPLLNAAGALYAKGVADPETVDKTWRIGTGAPRGPFEIFDIVGLTTAYNVSVMGDETSQRFAALLKENYIDKGKLGVATGEGFYRYE